MRRVAALALLAATALPLPAQAAPSGTLVIVVPGGAGWTTLRLDRRITLDWDAAVWNTGSWYGVALMTRAARPVSGGHWIAPERHDRLGLGAHALVQPGHVDAGPVRLAVAAKGPTTVRVPVEGRSGRWTVRLDRRLPLTWVENPMPSPAVADADDVVVDIDGPWFAANGWVDEKPATTPLSEHELCWTDADGDGPCFGGSAILVTPVAGLTYAYPDWGLAGPTHATIARAWIATAPRQVRHFVVAFPAP
jgi:hypothetical protein